jgi:hypothetical protein
LTPISPNSKEDVYKIYQEETKWKS